MTDYSIQANSFLIELILSKGMTYPTWAIEPAGTIINSVEINDTRTVLIDIPIDNVTSITLTNSGKTDQETIIEDGHIVKDQKISVNRIWVNEILLENSFVINQSQTIPNYSQSNLDYAIEHNIELDKVLFTDTLYFNGIWKFNFKQPFFKWYNQIIINELSGFNHWVTQSHLGLADDNQVEKLERLINQLA
jgi:hypothetical protein